MFGEKQQSFFVLPLTHSIIYLKIGNCVAEKYYIKLYIKILITSFIDLFIDMFASAPRPDIFLYSRILKQVVLIQVTIPWVTNISKDDPIKIQEDQVLRTY